MTRNGFRFMVVCRQAGPVLSDATTLTDVLDSLGLSPDAFPADVELTIAIGLFLDKPAVVQLDLVAFQVDKQGELQKVPGFSVGCLKANSPAGASIGLNTINLTLPEPGRYGFSLFDPDGFFGAPKRLLADYLYEVEIEQEGSHERN